MTDLIRGSEAAMKETDAFLDATMTQYRAAETALHNGDAQPRKQMWARTVPRPGG